VTRPASASRRCHEPRVLACAAGQRGLVTTAQLRAAGLSEAAIAGRIGTGWLRRVHRGVYAVGPVDAPWMPEVAALLACGPESALSHSTAGAVLSVLARAPALVEVSVAGHRRERASIRVHRVRAVEAVLHAGMRVTTPIRTLHDLAGTLGPRELARAVEQAQLLGLATHAELLTSLTSRRSPALREALTAEPGLTRSEAERRLRDLVRRAGLPEPLTNVRVAGHEVDAFWPAERLVVEVDGFAYHAGRAAFERDRRRDAEVQALGYRVMRVTWRRMAEEPEAVVAQLAAALAARRGAL
jgi:very-short-patch-repair endonuclease